MKKSVSLVALVAALQACSPATVTAPNPETPAGETPITAESLLGAWADDQTTPYAGGGSVRKSRQFEFSADGRVSLSVHVDDRPPSGVSHTYAEYQGSFQLDGSTITISADRYRQQATPFVSADQGWVEPGTPLAVYSCPAMVWGGHLYWNPDNPVWTSVASTDPDAGLTLETFTQEVNRPLERQTWSFFSGSSRLDIFEKDADGLWQLSVTMPLVYLNQGEEPIDTSVSPPRMNSPGIVSGNRYLFSPDQFSYRL